ncbi:VOC family protein [Chloroflexota bacterium]
MQIPGVDHLHVFEEDLEAAANRLYETLGIRWIKAIERDWVHIRVTFSDNGIEIIQPTGGDPIGIEAYLKKHGPGIGSVGLRVPDIEAAISEFEANGVQIESRGSYALYPERKPDIKAAIFKPESAHGIPFELVEYRWMSPMGIAAINLVSDMSWLQPETKPKSATSVRADRIDHINFFQDNLEASVKFFGKLLNIKWIGPIDFPELKLRVAFSEVGFNIVQPTGQDRMGVSDYMKKHGEGVGSLGFKVVDIEAAIKELASKGVRLIGRGLYVDKPNCDLKAAVFDPDSTCGIMVQLVEYQTATAVAIGNLEWMKNQPWMD